MKGRTSTVLKARKATKSVAIAVGGLLVAISFLAFSQDQDQVEEIFWRGASGVTNSTKNPLQIALLHWYSANLTTTFGVGINPRGLAFDGADIWTVNNVSNDVTKVRAYDGRVLGTFSVGAQPVRAAFDGANIWVTNSADNTVQSYEQAMALYSAPSLSEAIPSAWPLTEPIFG